MTRTLVLDENLIEHLTNLLRYNWKDECRDYEEHDGEQDCHIFVSIVALDNALNETTADPEDYVERSKSGAA